MFVFFFACFHFRLSKSLGGAEGGQCTVQKKSGSLGSAGPPGSIVNPTRENITLFRGKTNPSRVVKINRNVNIRDATPPPPYSSKIFRLRIVT